ncbi:hypothetical protein HK097_006935 [Rhizophlyctis rosea]|uniref:C3H1-type domain-containing protein n=1 Tax=Rhizophlyctis rosea TaxID=64517 RepID=A0AAD5SKI5_9FUNG|nr:hypothetical protein HK097_006935 [Rhizophlyctis rosea]
MLIRPLLSTIAVLPQVTRSLGLKVVPPPKYGLIDLPQKALSLNESDRAVLDTKSRSVNRSLLVVDGVSYKRTANKLINTAVAPAAKLSLRPKAKLVTIEGADFVMNSRGTKLVRKSELSKEGKTFARTIPQFVEVNGNKFMRTKGGNLILADKYRHPHAAKSRKPQRKRNHCQYYRFGKAEYITIVAIQLIVFPGLCNKKNGECPFVHDPDRIAICTQYLKGKCDNTQCKRSHRPTDKNVPDCAYFDTQRGCKKGDACLHRHVKLDEKASVCRAYAFERYCDLGKQCPHRHVVECPDFDANGKCDNTKCKLRHGRREKPARADEEMPDEEDLEALLALPIRPEFDRVDDEGKEPGSDEEEDDFEGGSDASSDDFDFELEDALQGDEGDGSGSPEDVDMVD